MGLNNSMSKTIDNVVSIMREFYWTQLKFLLILLMELFILIGAVSYWKSLSLMGATSVVYNKIFSGTFLSTFIIWVLIDVIPYAMVFLNMSKTIENGPIEKLSTPWTMFTGIFLGFDIVWLGFFWKLYFINGCIVAIRILMPYLLIKKAQDQEAKKKTPTKKK